MTEVIHFDLGLGEVGSHVLPSESTTKEQGMEALKDITFGSVSNILTGESTWLTALDCGYSGEDY